MKIVDKKGNDVAREVANALTPRISSSVGFLHDHIMAFVAKVDSPHAPRRVYVTTGMIVEEMDPGAIISGGDDLLPLAHGQAQALMDQLWANGLRPADVQDNAGVVTAKNAHIDDLRVMVREQGELVNWLVTEQQ